MHQNGAQLRRPQNRDRPRPLRVLVRRAVQRLRGGPRRRHQRSPPSAPTPPTGRSATRTAAAPSSVTRRSRATAPAAAARSRPTTWGPDGIAGTADDALGLDGIAGTADDHPENSTTTFRDNGAPQGDPNAPPGGRVGPDMPENSLWGVMYFGDNADQSFPLQIPAGDANDQYAADRIWRNTGISENTTTTIGEELVGWEWDSVPTQAQYLAQQPAGVKRLTSTNVDALGGSQNSWIIDEGRQRTNFPPAGMDGTVNAVRYTAPSGAQVFASGTMRWSRGLGAEERPADRAGDLQRPLRHGRAAGHARTASPSTRAAPTTSRTRPSRSAPNPVGFNTTVTFNASASKDPDGTIAKYEWDLDGNGTYETNSDDERDDDAQIHLRRDRSTVRLRVTDNRGATDVTVRTLNVIGNQFPTASFTATPNPAIQGLPVTFNASASSDPDGTITKYEWDLDGNGTYETNTGTNRDHLATYANPGTVQVGLRVTDNGGKTGDQDGAGHDQRRRRQQLPRRGHRHPRPDPLLAPGRDQRHRPSPTASAPARDRLRRRRPSASPAAIAGDPNPAARFDGVDDAAQRHRRPLRPEHDHGRILAQHGRLHQRRRPRAGAHRQLQPEQRRLPRRPQRPAAGGNFGVGIGTPDTRNNVFFARPSAGHWHHYAFVLDTTAPAATQIIPYVDGKAVAYTKTDSGTGSGSLRQLDPQLHVARPARQLFGRGALDERRDLRPRPDRRRDRRTLRELRHQPPAGRLLHGDPDPGPDRRAGHASTAPARATPTARSSNTSGTSTATAPTRPTPARRRRATRTFTANGEFTIGLRVTDNLTGTDTDHRARSKSAPSRPPLRSRPTPNPAVVGGPVHFNASASKDPDGTIVKYEWDLDGNGTYETNTGTTAAADRVYGAPGISTSACASPTTAAHARPQRLPSRSTAAASATTATRCSTRRAWSTTGAWARPAGPTIADSKGTRHRHRLASGVTFGAGRRGRRRPQHGRPLRRRTTPPKRRSTSPGPSKATVEFWLKWDGYADDDALALELTDNFNQNNGGFLVDPNAPQQGGKFGVGHRRAAPRATTSSSPAPAPASGTTTPSSSTPRRRRRSRSPPTSTACRSATRRSTAARAPGNFANSTLNFMSRAGPGSSAPARSTRWRSTTAR